MAAAAFCSQAIPNTRLPMRLSIDEIMAMDGMYRRHLINTLPGPRGVHLLGSRGYRGIENLGVFSSVVHLGASPPLLGFVLRPLTVPRHTYHHIQHLGYFTLNTLHPDMLSRAHQASANYPLEVSEFAAVGLTPEYTDTHPAPYVKESRIKLGLQWVEEYPIRANNTLFVVGKVIELLLPDGVIAADGQVDHNELQTLAVTGLQTYHRLEREADLGYARAPKRTN